MNLAEEMLEIVQHFPQRVVGGSQFLFHILMLMYMEEKELLDLGERKERTGRGIQNR